MASGDSLPFPSSSPCLKRQRSPSRSPSFGKDNPEPSRKHRRRHNLSVQVCQDFVRSICRRAEFACKFAHPLSTVIIERGRVIACADAMHNKCKRHRTCRYFHPPRHIRQSLFKAFSMEDAKDQVRLSTLRSNEGSEGIQRQRHDLSVDVCKDFIRSTCRRAEIDCKFAHPPSAVAIERGKVTACFDLLRGKCFLGRNCVYFHPPPHIQGPLLKAIGMEVSKDLMCQQPFSENHSYEIDDAKANIRECQQHNLSVDVCKDFIRRSCGRAEIDCKFAHPPSSVIIERGKVTVCFDSLSGKCFNVRTCPHFHPPPQIQESLLKEIGMEGAKDQVALPDLESSVKLARYPQPENDHESVPVCRDFLKNACNRHSCKYAHPDSLAMGHLQHHGLSLKLPSSTPLENGAIQNATRLYHDVVPVCKDFLKNSCKRDYCRYFHLVPQSEVYLQQHGTLVKLPCSPPPETEQKRLGVCRDFLKNACHRDSCKFAHPNSQKLARRKVFDNQVEICRDFSRGLCDRANCQFYHPRTCSAEK